MIATSNHVEGLDIKNNENIVIRNDVKEFAEAIVYFLRDKKK